MLWDEISRSVLKGKKDYQKFLPYERNKCPTGYRELYPGLEKELWHNRFFLGDNQYAMLALLQGNDSLNLSSLAGKINLIYIDPPFDSQRLYHYQIYLGREVLQQVAFSDQWERETFDYLQMLTLRLCLMRDLLAEDGSILLHVDYHISHYVKLLMDDIFGRNRFINEIVWCYGGGGAPKKHYSRKHDIILWYTKGKEWFFQPQYRPYRKGTLQRGLTAVKGERYELHREGAVLDDWWSEPEVQKILSPTAKENMKYETQKPEGLLRRILQGHSQEGDIVADFFCGSGTTGVVAEKMGRRWILGDCSKSAFSVTRRRILEIFPEDSWEAIRFFEDPLKTEVLGCLFQFETQIQDTLGGKVLKVSLIRYQVPETTMQEMTEKQRNIVKAFQKENQLGLIEYWDIGEYDPKRDLYQTKVYSARSYQGKNKGVCFADWQLSLPLNTLKSTSIGVRVADVFGNEQIIYEKVL